MNKVQYKFQLLTKNQQIAELEESILNYPGGHSEIQDIKKQIERIKGKGVKNERQRR